jgi:hypothetical protein
MNADEQQEAARLLWQAAADLVRADLEATTDLRWPLLIDDELGGDDLNFNHGSSGVLLPQLPPDAELAAAIARGDVAAGATIGGLLGSHLADMVNEDVMEKLERPWPDCNVHHRPLDPTPLGPSGTWQCSKDPRHAAPIGGLAGMVGPSRLLSFT